MARYFLEIAYDGANFHGWQIQKNAITVQEELQTVMSVLLGGNVETLGCGRTDTGVHAKQFYVHFDYENEIDKDEFIYKLNRMLPSSIAVFNLLKVHHDAHARFDAVSRTYNYFYHYKKDPFNDKYSVFIFPELDMNRMNEAASLLLKYDDFTSFSKLHSDNKTNLCKVIEAIWKRENHQLIFTITADRFLRNMVRAIVGTLILVGKHKITIDDFKNIIESKDRGEAGESVPAHGLFLAKVNYPFIK